VKVNGWSVANQGTRVHANHHASATRNTPDHPQRGNRAFSVIDVLRAVMAITVRHAHGTITAAIRRERLRKIGQENGAC